MRWDALTIRASYPTFDGEREYQLAEKKKVGAHRKGVA